MPTPQSTIDRSPYRTWLWLPSALMVAGCAATPGVAPESASISHHTANPVKEVIPPYSDEEMQAAAKTRGHGGESATTTLFEPTVIDEMFGLHGPLPTSGIVALEDIDPDVPGALALSVHIDAPDVVELPFNASALAAQLESIAASAEDPMPSQFVRALVPLIGYPLGGEAVTVDDFEFRTDLTEAERQFLHETASFSSRSSTRLASGEPARHVLEEELTRLLEAIRDPEPFSITFATLINEVRGLGDFTPRTTNKFLKGTNHDVRLYMDFEGVHWGFDGTNFSTELEIQIHVMKSDGYRVFSTGWESVRDSRARRVGVFAWSSFTLADDLEIGTYAIKIRVRQPETSHLAEHILPFEIVSRLAQGGAGFP